ncbi:MAG TPA: YbhB/YbcL family Raf kinase inhibitor-like protein [Candidatus Limnocylindrales bacterium]|nr:YbhB/YbcL family Raf kinase inhibitor-like protein [Candidatus Limnocylindrales bacterium]
MEFELSSPAFSPGSAIPTRYSCDGENVSPPLVWQGAPDGTTSLALLVDDPDARGFIHWVAFDLVGSQSGGLSEGVSSSPDAPPQGMNDFGRVGWGGPCPPSGTHQYRFRLYALDAVLGLTGTPKATELRAAMEGHIVGEAELAATYTRGG